MYVISFILAGKTDSAFQIVPLKRAVRATDFFCAKHDIRIIYNRDGEILYDLNIPFCMNIITNRKSQYGYIVTQTIAGPNGCSHFQKNIDPKDAGGMIILPRHKHNYYEMLYVLKGSAVHNIEDRFYAYSDGHACLLNRNTVHGEQFNKDCMLVYLCFSSEYTRELFENGSIKKKTQLLYNFAFHNLKGKSAYIKDYLLFEPVGIGPSEKATINNLIETLFFELHEKQPGQQRMVNALLVRLMSNFLDFPERYSCKHMVIDTRSESYLFNRITRYLENYPGRPSRKTLSDYFKYSADHLNRVVKKNSGMSLLKYNHAICIKKSEHMLKHTDKSISQIISELGFKNISHFYALFKKKHGLTLKQYRAIYR